MPHAKRQAADAVKNSCFRSTLFVAMPTWYNVPASFAFGFAFAIVHSSDSVMLVFFGAGFFSAPNAKTANIAHPIATSCFITFSINIILF